MTFSVHPSRLKLFLVGGEVKDYKGSRDITSLSDFVTANTEAAAQEQETKDEVKVHVGVFVSLAVCVCVRSQFPAVLTRPSFLPSPGGSCWRWCCGGGC